MTDCAMERLKEILHSGGHSLVVDSGGSVDVLDGRGVSDLLRMVETAPGMLRGARVADKVVGKAAASLMVLGGVKAVWADLVSQLAVELLKANGVAVEWGVMADHIENRARTGWCPLETACRDCATAGECLAAIKAFVSSAGKRR